MNYFVKQIQIIDPAFFVFRQVRLLNYKRPVAPGEMDQISSYRHTVISSDQASPLLTVAPN